MTCSVWFLIATFLIYHREAHALKCYSCLSEDSDKTCLDPLDVNVVQSTECTIQTSRNIARFFGNNLDEPLLRAAESATEFECIVYQKQYKDNQVYETARDCFPKSVDYDTCKALEITSSVGRKYDLKKCETCNTDNCNRAKDENNSATGLKMSALLCILISIFWTFI